jgi:hypothetical protein
VAVAAAQLGFGLVGHPDDRERALSRFHRSSLRLNGSKQTIWTAFIEALAHAERSPEFGEQMRDHYRRSQRNVARLVEAALGPDAVAKGADPMVVGLFLIAIFDGLAVQFRIAPEDTPTGEQLVDALVAALVAALEQDTGET